MLAQIYELCAKNLVYILPYYVQEVLIGASQQDVEFQGCIAQILSLMSSISTMSPQPTSKDLLILLCAFCLLGDETERLFTED